MNRLPNIPQLAIATLINCFSSRVYGEFEYYFSAIKVLTIVCISELTSNDAPAFRPSNLYTVVLSIVIDLGAGQNKQVTTLFLQPMSRD